MQFFTRNKDLRQHIADSPGLTQTGLGTWVSLNYNIMYCKQLTLHNSNLKLNAHICSNWHGNPLSTGEHRYKDLTGPLELYMLRINHIWLIWIEEKNTWTKPHTLKTSWRLHTLCFSNWIQITLITKSYTTTASLTLTRYLQACHQVV